LSERVGIPKVQPGHLDCNSQTQADLPRHPGGGPPTPLSAPRRWPRRRSISMRWRNPGAADSDRDGADADLRGATRQADPRATSWWPRVARWTPPRNARWTCRSPDCAARSRMTRRPHAICRRCGAWGLCCSRNEVRLQRVRSNPGQSGKRSPTENTWLVTSKFSASLGVLDPLPSSGSVEPETDPRSK
jgi:hypothetical protein